jgi:hypothetical protein
MTIEPASRNHVLHAAEPLVFPCEAPGIVLARSIEMGGASEWQREVICALEDLPLVFLNPLRGDWDASWAQSISNPESPGSSTLWSAPTASS